MIDERDPNFAKIQELYEFISSTKSVKEWKRGQTVKLRLLGFTYARIAVDLGSSFIAQTQRKYFEEGIAGLKLEYKGSQSYLTAEQKKQTIEWLYSLEKRNISELERWLYLNHEKVISKFCEMLT